MWHSTIKQIKMLLRQFNDTCCSIHLHQIYSIKLCLRQRRTPTHALQAAVPSRNACKTAVLRDLSNELRERPFLGIVTHDHRRAKQLANNWALRIKTPRRRGNELDICSQQVAVKPLTSALAVISGLSYQRFKTRSFCAGNLLVSR